MSYTLAIDQGTSSTRCLLFDSHGELHTIKHQTEFTQIRTHPGWLEHDPEEIMRTVLDCMTSVQMQLGSQKVAAIGVTNQRETCLVWDSNTGKPLYNAIVWSDTRTKEIVDKLIEKYDANKDKFKKLTGLHLSTYFSLVKVLWLRENVPAIAKAMKEGTALFGTIDTWIIYKLTKGSTHATDVSNASRTLMLNINTLDWDQSILDEFQLPLNMLPQVLPSVADYGVVADGFPFHGVRIGGNIGDQQAATLGQLCLKPGQFKSTYGTGCFILYNTGNKPVLSRHGLLTTVLYQLGPNEKPVYALEGGFASAGSTIRWLRDEMQLIKTQAEIDTLAVSVPDNGGVYFVNAFSGLFAPYWRQDARGTICGLTDRSNKAHFARSCLEAVAFQTRDVFEAIVADTRTERSKLEVRVDGGMAKSDPLLQIIADFVQAPVVRPQMLETTSFGAALCAGLYTGFYRSAEDLIEIRGKKSKVFQPVMSAEQKDEMVHHWKRAVDRSLGWVESDVESAPKKKRAKRM